jgi:PAS domain S-box-containing protein
LFKQFASYDDKNGFDFSINRLSLTFNSSAVEQNFSREYFKYNLEYSRVVHLIAIFFYCIVGLWDSAVIDPARQNIWLWVITAVSVMFLSGFTLSFFALNVYFKYWQQIFAFYVLMTGTGFAVVTVAASPNYPAYNFVGIIFCLFFCYTFIRLTFIWASVSGNAIVAIYTVGAGIFVAPPFKLLMTGFFYMLGINILGMMVCYSLELMARRDFILNKLLKHAENHATKMNAQLEQIVEERTRKLKQSNRDLREALNREKFLIAEISRDKDQLQKNLDSLQLAESIAKLGYFEMNWQTKESFWSNGFYKIFGFTNTSNALTHEAFIQLIHEDDRSAVIDHINESLQKKIDMDVEFKGLTINGDTVQIHGIAHNSFADNGMPFLSRGIIRDITDQKQAEKEKIKLEKQLHQAYKMESIGTLAGGIAHDFNNILSSIIGFTELSLDDADGNPELEDNLQEVYNAGKRAKDLVKQILAFARQTGEDVKPIQIDVIVEEVLKFIRSTIPATIKINKHINSKSAIIGNQTQVHQILMNLCTNAAHSMEKEGGMLDVSLKDIDIDENFYNQSLQTAYGKYIEIAVSDTGSGIEPDIIDSIFEPYFTTKSLGEGTGMGLAMVHGIVESYNGKITVDSQLGKGTTFTIYLPVTGKKKTHPLYNSVKLSSGTERILFVDDEVSLSKMGERILEGLGYSVTSRTSSVEALELFRSRPHDFDLVITDMTMPNMTGDRLAQELMAIKQDIPVILCTGYSKKISEAAASEIGIKAFIYKPIVKADLSKTVRKVLDESK